MKFYQHFIILIFITFVTYSCKNPADSENVKTFNISNSKEDDYFLDYSPIAKKILFRRDNTYLWIMNSDGSEQKQLTFIWSAMPAGVFSPDGNYIYITASVDDTKRSKIARLDIDGNNLTTLSDFNGDIVGIAPSGDMLLLDDNSSIAVFNLKSLIVSILVREERPSAFFQDGEKIAYVTSGNNPGSEIIRSIRIDGTNDELLMRLYPKNTFGFPPIYDFRFSPTSNEIVICTNGEKYIMNVDSTNRRNILDEFNAIIPSAYSPEGDRILFYTVREQSDGKYYAIVSDLNGMIVNELAVNVPIITYQFGPDNSIYYIANNQIHMARFQ